VPADSSDCLIVEAEPFATAGVMVAEVLQGLTRNVTRIEHYLSQWEMLEQRFVSLVSTLRLT
jgi:hypothetical protein